MSDLAEMLTSEQLGEMLQISPRTIKDQAAAGQIPHRRIGKHYRFNLEDVAAIVADAVHPAVRPTHGGFR